MTTTAAPTPLRHAVAATTLAALLVYWLTADFFGYEILAEIAVLAILAMSLDLLAGYAGLVSLGHAALYGFGAYAYAVLTAMWGWHPLPAMGAATAITGVVACLVGAVVTRVQGVFFIMITLAVGEMGHEFFFQNRSTGGDDGFFGIPRLDLSAIGVDLSDPAVFALTLILVAAAVYVLIARLLASSYGAVLVGLHGNPDRMRALGLPVRAYQTSIFALAGAIAGFAGTLTAQHTQFITPQLLHWTTSGEVLVMVIVGGLGTLIGPVIGAAAMTMLRHEFSAVTDYWGFWLGLFLIAVVMARRGGMAIWLEWAIGAVVRRGSASRRNGEAADAPH